MIVEVWATIYDDGTLCVSVYPSDTANACISLTDGEHCFITSITGNDWDDCKKQYELMSDKITLLVSLTPKHKK